MTNHLWQSTLFAMAAGLLAWACRRNRAQIRYWLWFSASLKFLLPFALLMSVGSHMKLAPMPSSVRTFPASHAVERMARPFSTPVPVAPRGPHSTDWIRLAAVCAWACGFACIVLVRFRGWRQIQAALRSSGPLDLRTTIEIRSSPGLLEPGVVGLLRPIILLPAGILERLAPVALEALLAHELCHVRRRDNLRSAVHMIVEALFWFHPLVWWIGARLMEERERACDEDVLRGGSDPGVYARAILNVCRHYVESPLVCVSGITGADLKKRIEKIMARELAHNLQLPKKLLLAAGACAAITMPVAIGLLHAQSQFEVASIRPHQGPLHRVFDFSSSGPRLRLEGYSAPLLIMEAYNLKSYQVSLASVPGDTYYDIAAEADEASAPSKAEFRRMLQALLADRFRLKVHRERKEMPVYALVVGKGGPRFAESPSDAVFSGFHGVNGRNQNMTLSKASMDVVAEEISNYGLDRPVVDQTGLTGFYDIKMEATPEYRMSRQADGERDISVFDAVQQQLGLKLKPSRALIEVLVVDHIEKPSEN
jgi:uncharacterized protein (TIGR03435 family)